MKNIKKYWDMSLEELVVELGDGLDDDDGKEYYLWLALSKELKEIKKLLIQTNQ